jgi:hypothetical protein
MSYKLKPCPFCGSEKIEIKQTGKNKLKLKCCNCLIGIEQKWLRFDAHWLEERMAEDWNKRVSLDRLDGKGNK